MPQKEAHTWGSSLIKTEEHVRGCGSLSALHSVDEALGKRGARLKLILTEDRKMHVGRVRPLTLRHLCSSLWKSTSSSCFKGLIRHSNGSRVHRTWRLFESTLMVKVLEALNVNLEKYCGVGIMV